VNRLYLVLILCVGLLVSGCASKGLTQYQEAVLLTDSIERGEKETEIKLVNTFNKVGLSIEEEKALSNYEKITVRTNTIYDNMDESRFIANLYYIVGGLGIDSRLFKDEEKIYVQLPFVDKYFIIEQDGISNYFDTYEVENLEKNSKGNSLFIKDIKKIKEQWLKVFEEEDVVVGKTEYILTDEGQIKTTVYNFQLDQEQLQELKTILTEYIDLDVLNEMVNKSILQSGYMDTFSMKEDREEGTREKNIETEDKIDIKKWFDRVTLTNIEGQAYVDFDNRLIKQNFTVQGTLEHAEPGDLESIEVYYQEEYMNLGNEQKFKFPDLTEDNSLDINSMNEYFKETFQKVMDK